VTSTAGCARRPGGPARRWLAIRHACVAALVAACVAGCVGMPAAGPPAEFGASPQATQLPADAIGQIPSAPQPGATPRQVVEGFLVASASGPAYAVVARQYLVGSASRTWSPSSSITVFSSLDPPSETIMPPVGPHGAQRAMVNFTGTEQATFEGSGQYVWAQSQGQPFGGYRFSLIKVDGQWRISNPPGSRMLTATEFPLYYQAQDLYFFNLDDEALVPDSVFVPLDTPPQTLVNNLVDALIQGPRTWLQAATDTDVFPDGTAASVQLNGDAAVVNLTGSAIAHAGPSTRELISAQLVWTLTGTPIGPSSSIRSVVLEIDGSEWTPSASASSCQVGRVQTAFQTQADYECYNPYPAVPASFYYAADGRLWSRCGSESAAEQNLIGRVIPVVGRSGAFNSPRCGEYQAEESTASPPVQPKSLPASSRAAVSPDGKYLAIVPRGRDAVDIGALSGAAASFPATPRPIGSGLITALSWDRNDELWVVQGGQIFVVSSSGKVASVSFGGDNVTDLSVAPDGVRVALVVQTPSGDVLELAAIHSAAQTRGRPSIEDSLIPGARFGPGITRPMSLTWYDAAGLIVLNAAAGASTLWEVPVDGRQAVELPPPPAGAVSISAHSAANALVAGLSGGHLAVSAGLDGQWYTLSDVGQNPAYPG
jgi:Lipoprotein LpqB beta-propeller domain/Sporulation and spore germination